MMLKILITVLTTVAAISAQSHTKIGVYPEISTSSCGIAKIIPHPKSGHKYLKSHKSIKQLRELKAQGFKANGEAVMGEFPWMASIMRPVFNQNGTTSGQTSFGGAIINDRWILTSAHSVYQESDSLDPNDLMISIGSVFCVYDYAASYDLNITFFSADQIFIHPKYDDKTLKFDIALIKTIQTMKPQMTNNYYSLISVCLPETNLTNSEEELAVMSGCGGINNQKEQSKFLRRGELKIFPYVDSSNESLNNEIFAEMQGKDYAIGCEGHSGYPLVQYVDGKGVLIGLFSSILNIKPASEKSVCAPGILKFQRVSKYTDWIVSTISEKSKNSLND